MSINALITSLHKVSLIAKATKLRRFLYRPYRYIKAIGHRKLIYKYTHQEIIERCNTFFGSTMSILLPSSTDIYLTGGKSHDSEIKLAKFLIRHLKESDTFIDIGSHYGYFSMLAAKLVGPSGKVIAFEAAPKTYKILSQNTANLSNGSSYNLAVSDTTEHLKFYEFPNLYAEYNTLKVDQFKKEEWFIANQPKEIVIPSIILTDFLNTKKIYPDFIKIDVEGAEDKVINGLQTYLTAHAPVIIMEFLSESRGSLAHYKAEVMLKNLKFLPFFINNEGFPEEINSLSNYMNDHQLESDNIVFMKKIS